MKYILITIGVILLSGCTTINSPITEYRVEANIFKSKGDVVEGCKDKSLKIAQAFSSNALMSLRMDYAQPSSRIFSYSESQWRESPNHSVTQQMVKVIRDSNLFKDVQVSKSRSRNNWILETTVEDFMQYFSDDLKESHVNVAISATLVDIKTGSVIATNTFSSKIKSKTLDAKGGVDALNSALSVVLQQNIEWLNGVCR
ncbi:MAG: ABC-type transport auxiliary lipoprotein family protein [Sulfurimonas sp.]|nr:ABC-type transport auxiliary lipoprotein family protein [Sulfurimonas sp.]